MGGWGGGVAAACLTVLSLWRWQDGQAVWAVVLLALAFAQLAVAARRASVRRDPGGDRPVGPDLEHARRHRPAWRVIGLTGVIGALACAPFLPPVALVLAALGVYATWRARSYGRLVATSPA